MGAKKSPLTVPQILAWANEHRRRTGRWPSQWSGKVVGTAAETWTGINDALRRGGRGFLGGSSLSRLLAEQRRKPPGGPRRQALTVKQILAWADDWHARTGRWPSAYSGAIPGSNGETWKNIYVALLKGARGLPHGFTLPRLLLKHGRGTAGRAYVGQLTVKQILAWADAHYRRTGQWPQAKSGPIVEAPGETWSAINSALNAGLRGLKPGSLAKLLWQHRSARSNYYRPKLSINQILLWADVHYHCTGTWPTSKSGEIPDSGGEKWSLVDYALRYGHRGLKASGTLARLLARRRGAKVAGFASPLTIGMILAWCDKHFRRTATWPCSQSGPVLDAPDEKWSAIDTALRAGLRGLAGGDSLARLLERERGVSPNARRAKLTVCGILAWADAYHRRTGRWPVTTSGPIPESPGDTWAYVALALTSGGRGLPTKGTTLRQLLAKRRGVPLRRPYKDRLTVKQILEWADAHQRRTGHWPQSNSGPVDRVPKQTWAAVNTALRIGCRGLKGGESLRALLAKHRRTDAGAR